MGAMRKCKRCGYEWEDRRTISSALGPMPRQCPHCKSAHWNKDKEKNENGIHKLPVKKDALAGATAGYFS